MVHKTQIYDKLLDLSEMSLTHTSEMSSCIDTNELDIIDEVDDEYELHESDIIPDAASSNTGSLVSNTSKPCDNVSIFP